MPIPPPENDNNLAAAPLGDDALQDYMSSLFLGTDTLEEGDNNADEDQSAAAQNSQPAAVVAIEPKAVEAKPEQPKQVQASPQTSTPEQAAPTPAPATTQPVPAQPSFEEWENRSPANNPVSPPKPLAAPQQAHAEPIVRITAEQIPSDVPLSDEQKKGLQKLLDQKLLIAPEPLGESVPNVEPAPDRALAPSIELAPNIELAPKTVPIEPEAPAVIAAPVIPPAVPREEVAAIVDNKLPEELPDKAVAPLNTTHQVPQASEPKDSALTAPAVPNYREHWIQQLPDWGQSRFDVLLFSARGVTLAIPLIALGHIYLQNAPLNQVPGLPPWVIGVKPLTQGQLKVIDAGAFFTPDRPNRLNTDEDIHLLSIADSQWAFAVDSVANPVTIGTTDVQWRPLSAASPWLAGAIKQHMCVLVDTPALLKLLSR
ncbi:chemotaxis protein CheW [Marinagarivorans cellulosilyticus]|uniref:CheW-like domain-containing protein n=1 Tax=Marinagarivorans cellulosilyticus TaxID=2721545 RepID=A0AAN1WK81_9GAMM|nr:chemotaxis protein CheW [Marinagarivorans cellulosilyticus]BCD99171.1 hypothetical protein MARGE09_P3372 [Marinagarivorans cellulosilyticus]